MEKNLKEARLNKHKKLKTKIEDSWFALMAEKFARLFGTPFFLIAQTMVVSIWMITNIIGVFHFDPMPFILLNLAFSTQAAYAAPLILLAQTRQTDRDKRHSEADALHREEIAQASEDRANITLELLRTNQELILKIDALTKEVHEKIMKS